MALYKALAAGLMSGSQNAGIGPWEVGEWNEITGELWWDVHGKFPLRRGNGFFCSDDILHCQWPVFTEYIAQVQTSGASIIYGKDQCWERMKVVSIKAWPPSKSTLVLDWAEGRAHDAWASWWPSEAAIYDAKHYQGQYAQMLAVIAPVYQSLFFNPPPTGQFYTKRVTRIDDAFKSPYAAVQEPIIRLAYALALALTGTIAFRGAAGFVQLAENLRPGSWELIRGFTADLWAGLPEL